MTAIVVDEQFIGAGQIYIDDALFANTRENNVWRVIQELAAPRLNSVRGQLARTDYIVSEMAQLDFTPVELSAQRIPLMIPGAKVTAEAGDGILLTGSPFDSTLAAASLAGATNVKITAATNANVGDVVQIGPSGATREFRRLLTVGTTGSGGTGCDLDYPLTNAHDNGVVIQEVEKTTLALDSAAGVANIKVAAVTTYVAGNFVRIGYPPEVEVRKILTVGTLGSGGTGLTLEYPLNRSHRLGDDVVEITNEGGSLIEASESRRLQAADYHKYELVVPGVGNRSVRLGILLGLHVGNAEFTAQDSEVPLGPRLTIQSRINPDNIEASPWYIRRTSV